MSRLPLTVVLAGLLCAAQSASAQATQPTNGIIRGSVFDPSNAQIPGVRIILTNQGTEINRVTTNERGEYSIESPAGTYGLRAELPGFDTAIRVVELKQSATLQLDITMVTKPRLPVLVGTLKRSRLGATAGVAPSGFDGKWERERPASTATGFGSESRGQSLQAEFNVEGAKVTGTLSIGGLGGTFHVIRDGKLVGTQFRFQTTAMGFMPDPQTGRRITSTAITTWIVQLVDENTIELRSELEIDNGVFADPAR